MRLEEEIKQKAFKTPQQKLAVNLLYSCHWLNAHYSGLLKNTDITVQQYNVLRILRGQHPGHCSLKDIKERMLDRMSDASRIVDKLVARGYVSRVQCPEDRRSVRLHITPKGLKSLKELDYIDDATLEIFRHLTTKQVEELNRLLDDMRGKNPQEQTARRKRNSPA